MIPKSWERGVQGDPSSSSAKQKPIFPGLPKVARSTAPGLRTGTGTGAGTGDTGWVDPDVEAVEELVKELVLMCEHQLERLPQASARRG